MTDDPKKPPDTDDGWEPTPAADPPADPPVNLPADPPADPPMDPIDPATGYAMHPADPAYPGSAPDPVTGYVSYSSPPIDPVPPLGDAPADPGVVAPNPDDAPILPATYDDASLRGDISGVPPAKPPKRGDRRDHRDDHDDDEGDPRKIGRRRFWITTGSIVAGVMIVTLVLLGRANSSEYQIACDSDKILAVQGRGFPPWGTSPLQGAEWKPITIAPNAECTPQETDNLEELEGWYLKILIDQASGLLTAREVTKPDIAAEQLNQALLLARTPERRDQRKEIERLLGDVDYWRASTKLRDAATALADAAKQFDAAAAQRPRHVTDAAAWATYIRKLVDQLHAGPAGGMQTAFPPLPPGAERQPAPPGVALPVEPDQHGSDVAPLAPPDAGAPSGGVLL